MVVYGSLQHCKSPGYLVSTSAEFSIFQVNDNDSGRYYRQLVKIQKPGTLPITGTGLYQKRDKKVSMNFPDESKAGRILYEHGICFY